MADDDLFAKAMGMVQPLQKPEKVEPKKRPPRPRPASRHGTVIPTQGNAAHAGPEATDEAWVLCADGISRERLRRLASGQPPVHSEIDLHGMNRDAALAQLEQHAGQMLAEGGRVLCIVHGRGLHSQGKPVLKDAVYQWLREGPYAGLVLAVIPTPNSGGGSCLALFRRKKN